MRCSHHTGTCPRQVIEPSCPNEHSVRHRELKAALQDHLHCLWLSTPHPSYSFPGSSSQFLPCQSHRKLFPCLPDSHDRTLGTSLLRLLQLQYVAPHLPLPSSRPRACAADLSKPQLIFPFSWHLIREFSAQGFHLQPWSLPFLVWLGWVRWQGSWQIHYFLLCCLQCVLPIRLSRQSFAIFMCSSKIFHLCISRNLSLISWTEPPTIDSHCLFINPMVPSDASRPWSRPVPGAVLSDQRGSLGTSTCRICDRTGCNSFRPMATPLRTFVGQGMPFCGSRSPCTSSAHRTNNWSAFCPNHPSSRDSTVDTCPFSLLFRRLFRGVEPLQPN